jgi:hypothetical protein
VQLVESDGEVVDMVERERGEGAASKGPSSRSASRVVRRKIEPSGARGSIARTS